jgi:hypothetical protein
MNINELNKLLKEQEREKEKFLSLFGGGFFTILFGPSVYENGNGCFALNDYDEVKKLILLSIEKNKNLLEELPVVKAQNT